MELSRPSCDQRLQLTRSQQDAIITLKALIKQIEQMDEVYVSVDARRYEGNFHMLCVRVMGWPAAIISRRGYDGQEPNHARIEVEGGTNGIGEVGGGQAAQSSG